MWRKGCLQVRLFAEEIAKFQSRFRYQGTQTTEHGVLLDPYTSHVWIAAGREDRFLRGKPMREQVALKPVATESLNEAVGKAKGKVVEMNEKSPEAQVDMPAEGGVMTTGEVGAKAQCPPRELKAQREKATRRASRSGQTT